MGSGWQAPLLLSLLLASAALLPFSLAFNRYTIGGSKGWNPGVNYTLWVNDTRFYVGDWLVFYYQSGQADIVQVNKTDYDNCVANNPITSYSKGRSYAFQLNHTGDFYFICSRGYCYQGMKLHIKAEKVPPPPAPAKHLHTSAAPPAAWSSATAALVPAALLAVLRLFL